MNTNRRSIPMRFAQSFAALAACTVATIALAQPTGQPDPAAAHALHTQPPQPPQQQQQAQPAPVTAGDANADLVNQIAALRAEVAKLQAALMQGHAAPVPASAGGGMGMGGKGKMQGPMGSGQMQPMQPMQPMQTPPAPGAGGMPGMSGGSPGGGGGMGMMDMDKMMAGMGGMGGGASGGGMGGMPGGGGGGMGMDGMMKMMGMGSMPMGGAGSPVAMAMPSALPGFPGASHIYHIGATGFFLDHAEHITLTLEQQTALSQKKEQALLQQAELQRKIAQAEQELWVLTAADQPDAVTIEQKVQEVARKQGEQRLAFIRAVGEAAKVLTDDQRKQLTGMLPAAPTPAPQPAMPQQSGGMGHM